MRGMLYESLSIIIVIISIIGVVQGANQSVLIRDSIEGQIVQNNWFNKSIWSSDQIPSSLDDINITIYEDNVVYILDYVVPVEFMEEGGEYTIGSLVVFVFGLNSSFVLNLNSPIRIKGDIEVYGNGEDSDNNLQINIFSTKMHVDGLCSWEFSEFVFFGGAEMICQEINQHSIKMLGHGSIQSLSNVTIYEMIIGSEEYWNESETRISISLSSSSNYPLSLFIEELHVYYCSNNSVFEVKQAKEITVQNIFVHVCGPQLIIDDFYSPLISSVNLSSSPVVFRDNGIRYKARPIPSCSESQQKNFIILLDSACSDEIQDDINSSTSIDDDDIQGSDTVNRNNIHATRAKIAVPVVMAVAVAGMIVAILVVVGNKRGWFVKSPSQFRVKSELYAMESRVVGRNDGASLSSSNLNL